MAAVIGIHALKIFKNQKKEFNRLRAIWLKGYQRESL